MNYSFTDCNMKRNRDVDAEKEIKKQKLLKELGDKPLQYFTPKDAEFQHLWKTHYSKLLFKEANKTPHDLHEQVQSALLALLDHGCFFQDLVRMKGKDIFTPISRLLIGIPGCTYKYLNTRLFAIPWPTSGKVVRYSDDQIFKACQALLKLNDYLCTETVKALQEQSLAQAKEVEVTEKAATLSMLQDSVGFTKGRSPVVGDQTNCSFELENRASFNVTLLNYMDPLKMVHLKDEPYFGMGKMAVSWHHDENLVERSTVAVYSYSCKDSHLASDDMKDDRNEGRDPVLWHVGLKRAWDIQTPGLAVPLLPGDCYFMLDDLNMTHQHCVLAGLQPRFSSTHRVAECSTGTLNYIFGRCQIALNNLRKDPSSGTLSLASFDLPVLKQTEEIHNEVEFEWLRQFWFQGKRYGICSDWWYEPMAKMEDLWREMEIMTNLALCEVRNEEWPVEEKQELINCLLTLLMERQELRKDWVARCNSRLALSLPSDQQPECHPYWTDEDLSMPLPFNLEQVISDLQAMLDFEDQAVRDVPRSSCSVWEGQKV
nr:PREDICTED: alpha-ketoglutarate-dependent dioxygenase FTO [Latimeria chalumnae]|eukprot:XP_005997313.1 PREDICTED: alpha-ketoglutarate-dependent dioxygenase FTO [Latimeria chalumnae]